MKIAILGHPTRGKEVIQIFESLGGINRCQLDGNSLLYYYIDYDYNKTIYCHDDVYVNKYCKKYTLEEFEEEFPFKIGDKVTIISDIPYKIIALEYSMGRLSYKLDNGLHYISKVLTLYKEMKEERNITLSLEKAKEWYNKGGELKEIALQAFTEKELNSLPRSWEEFCRRYSKTEKEAYIGTMSAIHSFVGTNCDRDVYADRNICPSQKSAEAHLAMIQLEQLRNCWRQGWAPTLEESYYTIKFGFRGLDVYNFCTIEFLSFPTREMAEEFLKCFRDLIEKAGDLI